MTSGCYFIFLKNHCDRRLLRIRVGLHKDFECDRGLGLGAIPLQGDPLHCNGILGLCVLPNIDLTLFVVRVSARCIRGQHAIVL